MQARIVSVLSKGVEVKDFLLSPHQVDDEKYRRFEQKYICFARAQWDESFKAHGKGIGSDAPSRAEKDLPGYTRLLYALQNAAWTLYATYPGGFSWNRIGESRDGTSGEQPELDPFTEAFGPYKVESTKEMSAVVKRVAQIFGSPVAGVAEVDPRWVYSHKIDGEPLELPEGVKYAIVMLVEMDEFGIEGSPNLTSAVATGSGYSQMAYATACMSEFIRNLGYRAIASGNDTAVSVPLAVDAGLGEFGRNGLLINPQFGQRVRICKVFTDLPLAADGPVHFGAKRFCLTCMKCADFCPSQSIPKDREPTWDAPYESPSNNPGVKKWYVNADTCYEFWTKNTAECSNCIRVCPYTKSLGWHHALIRFFIHRAPFLNRLWLLGDTLFGYHRQADPKEFWKVKKWLQRRRF
ncbi:MAG: reductive dehalogenase [Planctomycetota bacterium]|jgi:reductive dehalogenase